MASHWFLLVSLVLITDSFCMPSSSSLASDHNQNSEIPSIISASPAATLSIEPPQSLSPYQEELSPDISPLLPSPGGTLPSPTSSSMPTIPANPSPPNPDDDDEFLAPGPNSAFSPFGSLPVSSLAPANLLQPWNLSVYVAATVFCLIHQFAGSKLPPL